MKKALWFFFGIFLLSVGTVFTSCQSSQDPRDAPTVRVIDGSYYLQKVDYFSEYYLVKYDDEKGTMERVIDERIQLIDWKKDHIYVTTARIDFLDIDTREPLADAFQNSTTSDVGTRTDFQLKEPHQAWEILLKKSGNQSKYYQFIVGITVITVLAGAVIYFIRLNKTKGL